MRPVIFLALLGTTLSTNPATAQSSAGQPEAGAAQPKPEPKPERKRKFTGTSLTDALTENAHERPNALAESRGDGHRESTEESAADSRPVVQAAPAPVLPTVLKVPPGPPQKNLTGEEFKLIRVGSTQKEVLAVLGPPSSRVVVPDDDGHLRETFQYWVKGSPMGTVRLDNGHVVQIETKLK